MLGPGAASEDSAVACVLTVTSVNLHGGDTDANLMFAGHAAYNFKRDPFYSNGFVPTVKQLVDRILTGD